MHPHFSSWPVTVVVLVLVFFLGYIFGVYRTKAVTPSSEGTPTVTATSEETEVLEVEVYRNPFDDASSNPFQ